VARGARRKKRGPKARKFGRVAHRARPVHKGRHPMHITLRARHGLPSFRQQMVHALVLQVLGAQRRRAYGSSFQIAQFSIQANHLHMVVEADDGPTKEPSSRSRNPLRSGISGFLIAFARRLNRMLGRKGKVWDDRYHRHDLATPHEVKTSLRYVLSNFLKHGELTIGDGAFDIYSSATYFDGWARPPPRMSTPEPFPETTARTWLLSRGWKRHGLLDLAEVPGPRATRR
jgi:REP element-mobilizing transposase RayT